MSVITRTSRRDLTLVGEIRRRGWMVAAILLGCASTLHAATATASWDPNPESSIGGYVLSWGTQSGVYTQTKDVGNVTSYQVTGLLAGRRYFFVIQAYNTSGVRSPFSTEVPYDVPSPTITRVSPASGPIGTAVTISGANFGTTNGTVTFNGATATPMAWADATIRVPVPPGATSGSLIVTVDGVASNAVPFNITVFTDDPIILGSTLIRAVHITELRSKIDVIRVANGLTAYTWLVPSLSGGVMIDNQHITELRAALAAAYVAASRTPPTYTNDPLLQGVPVKAVHIAEIRAAIIAIQ